MKANKYLARARLLNGVVAISLELFDGRVSLIGMVYDNSLNWESSHALATQVASALNLPTEWALYEESSRYYSADRMRVLRCGETSFIAGLKSIAGQRLPVIHWTDLTAVGTLTRRVTAEAERRQRMKEARRKTFKP